MIVPKSALFYPHAPAMSNYPLVFIDYLHWYALGMFESGVVGAEWFCMRLLQ